jgi:hypothetical protein
MLQAGSALRPDRTQRRRESIYPTSQSTAPTLPLGYQRFHRVTNSYFFSNKAVTTHFSRSYICQNEPLPQSRMPASIEISLKLSVCQTEGKGVRTVTMQYIPSSRAKDHAGHVGAPGAWPVLPAVNARAAPEPHVT